MSGSREKELQQQAAQNQAQYRPSPLNPRRATSANSNATSLQPLNANSVSRNTSQSEGSSDGSADADLAGQFGVGGGLGPYPNVRSSFD